MSGVMVSILVNCAPSGEMHNYCTPHIIKENFENFLIHRCNYILLSQVYCAGEVVKTPTILLNNPVFLRNVFLNRGTYLLMFVICVCIGINISRYFVLYYHHHVTALIKL